jgi:hypothetical protein
MPEASLISYLIEASYFLEQPFVVLEKMVVMNFQLLSRACLGYKLGATPGENRKLQKTRSKPRAQSVVSFRLEFRYILWFFKTVHAPGQLSVIPAVFSGECRPSKAP